MITRKPLDIVGAKWVSQQDKGLDPRDWVICEVDGCDYGGFVMCRQRMDERFTDERRAVWDRAAACMTALASLNPAAVPQVVKALEFYTTGHDLGSIAQAALTALRQPADAKGGKANGDV